MLPEAHLAQIVYHGEASRQDLDYILPLALVHLHVVRLLLLASQGQRFDRHVLVENSLWLRGNLTHFVGQVTMHELFQTKLHHILVDPLGCSIIDCVALGQENDSIEHLEDFCAWLVNGGHDRLSTVGLFSHQLH